MVSDVLQLFGFIRGAIEGREYAKFVFTRTLSDVLELTARLGREHGLDREEMSYVEIQRIIQIIAEHRIPSDVPPAYAGGPHIGQEKA